LAGCALDDLADRQLEPFIGEETMRIQLQGPHLLLAPVATQNIGLALHGLATNAAKHGALSKPLGRVRITWHHAPPRMFIEWRERDGPPTRPPVHNRFCHAVLARVVPEALDGEAKLEFHPEGFSWTLKILAKHVL
jgi:two-component sensor histidine kinase